MALYKLCGRLVKLAVDIFNYKAAYYIAGGTFFEIHVNAPLLIFYVI